MPKTEPSLEVRLERVIKARRELVFAAWTQPELMLQWMGPGPTQITDAQADARVGGAYRVTLTGNSCAGEGKGAVMQGNYTEIVPNERLRFTWTLPGEALPTTTVTVEFSDADGGTLLRLTHQGFPDAAERDRHEHGWRGCLNNLESLAARNGADFNRRVEIAAPRQKVYEALATAEGNGSWWMKRTSGSGGAGGTLRMDYGKNHLLMRVDRAEPAGHVQWTCTECTSHPDWVGTRLVFSLAARGGTGSVLHFRHEGLRPALECFQQCSNGWDKYLPSLAAYAEKGEGWPNPA